MHERMEFPWTVKEVEGIEPEGLTYIGHPDGTETLDPECLAAKALPDLIEALQDARGYLQIAVEYNGKIGNLGGFKESIERINEALKMAGVE